MRSLLALVIATTSACAAPSAHADGAPSIYAQRLVKGCLEPPSVEGTERLASSVRAKPWSAVRNQKEVGTHSPTLVPDGSRPGESQRTSTAITRNVGWDLTGPGGGQLVYMEEETRTDWVLSRTGQATTGARGSHDRGCSLRVSIANARQMLEYYLTLVADEYGVLISPDGARVDVFRFEPDRYDIELAFVLQKPLRVATGKGPESGMRRLVLTDPPGGFMNAAHPSIPTVTLAWPDFLVALDQPAELNLGNLSIEPSTQRLSALP